MKKILLFIGLLLLTSYCYAQVSTNNDKTEAVAEGGSQIEFLLSAVYPFYQVGYMNPKAEGISTVICKYIVYDKDEHAYYCYDNIESKTLKLMISVDENGNRLQDIVYNSSPSQPFIKNVFELYPDGNVKKLQSFLLPNTKPSLVLNYYSDGALRSAYLYGKGYSNSFVLRKSKESHPTIGGYTSKQYDFNGNYERNINWDIEEYNPPRLWIDYYDRISK